MHEGTPIEDLNPDLLNPKRLVIMSILYVSGPKMEVDLMRALEISWGDLDSNLRRLRERGYVSSRKALTLKGPRTIISITERGINEYAKLVEGLKQLLQLDTNNFTVDSKSRMQKKGSRN